VTIVRRNKRAVADAQQDQPRPDRAVQSRAGGRSGGGGAKKGGEPPAGVRLQRVMAAAGVAARRICEEMILAGRVEVNGSVVRGLPVFVDPTNDTVLVDGRALPKAKSKHVDETGRSVSADRLLYVMVFKPERVMTTSNDPGGRRTIMEFVDHPAARTGPGQEGARLVCAGRLDFHTAGLVLLTNDGPLINRLTHARYGVKKTYQAVIKGHLDDGYIADLEKGLNLKNAKAAMGIGQEGGPPMGGAFRARRGPRGGRAGVKKIIAITKVEREPGRTMLELTLSESGERPLREMLVEAGCKVGKLTRITIGPLLMKGVALGGWRELERQEVRALREAAGLEGRKPRRSKPAGPKTHEDEGAGRD